MVESKKQKITWSNGDVSRNALKLFIVVVLENFKCALTKLQCKILFTRSAKNLTALSVIAKKGETGLSTTMRSCRREGGAVLHGVRKNSFKVGKNRKGRDSQATLALETDTKMIHCGRAKSVINKMIATATKFL